MADASPDASLIGDDGLVETSAAGLTYPWGKKVPQSGETIRIAPGISWARIPMDGSLGHINSWLLDDEGGVAPVDTGLQMSICSNEWKALFAGALKDVSISRVICTHLHPDHTGLAGWLCKKYDAKLWMTRGEWLTVRMLTADGRDEAPPEVAEQQKSAGWTQEQMDWAAQKGWARFKKIVYPFPVSYQRLKEGDVLDMGGNCWRIVVGSGHSPEHACLWNEKEGVLVSGDQVLPRISSNVSTNISEPESDPLGEWLDSIDKLLEVLPADLLVCPAHGEPFKGLHTRLIALRDEHNARLDRVAEAIKESPCRAVDCFGLLFNREIVNDNRDLATGEAFAHLHRLERDGRARREIRDGVKWFLAA